MRKIYGTSEIVIAQPAGYLRVGTIRSYDGTSNIVSVLLRQPAQGVMETVDAQLPVAYLGFQSGMFIGGIPETGTPVIVSQAESGQWFIVAFMPRDPAPNNNTVFPNLPLLEEGELKIQANDTNVISLSIHNGISLGETNNSILLDTSRQTFTDTFDHFYSFSEASKNYHGIIRRERVPSSTFAGSLRNRDPSYDDHIKEIGMDPIFDGRHNISNIGSFIRNPPRIEKREIIYEYAESAKVLNNNLELNSYAKNIDNNTTNIIDRRQGKADALSLSLVEPNYLLEIIAGTVVDVYGNLLDINRSILPIGQSDNLSAKNIKNTVNEKDDNNVFKLIKKLERRSLAYHFELNARKDLFGPPDTNKRNNFARDRSRFYLDIDKEGLLKLNVPASSNTGNIPLFTRYENLSTISPNDKSKDPNDIVFSTLYKDIFQESFAANYDASGNLLYDNTFIELKDDLNVKAVPIDRFSSEDNPSYLKHGTVYHNLSKICPASQKYSSPEYTPTTSYSFSRVTPKEEIISSKLIMYGPDANAGGRSASVNLDGSLELVVGANTADRHSIWLDTQGAIIGAVGRDLRNNISLALSLDGEMLIESGGKTPGGDSRFVGKNNGFIAGAVDIKVYNGSKEEFTVIRIDQEGITMSTPSRLVVSANGHIQVRSSGQINIDGEDVIIQGRKVKKDRRQGSI